MLSELSVQNLRSINSFQSPLSSRCNFIYGSNGSGKTSFLEAIALLARGRSFRSHIAKDYIQHGQLNVTVRGVLINEDTLQVSRSLHGKPLIKHNYQDLFSIAELSRHLPLQVINQTSFDLLSGSSRLRREFMDWGVFHVEQSFFQSWRLMNSALDQRNAALRQESSYQEVAAWNASYIQASMDIDLFRETYLKRFISRFNEVLPTLLPLPIDISYYRGWSRDYSLEEALENDKLRDKLHGYTHSGPNRADLKIEIENRPVCSVLSRGQQKLLVMAMILTRGLLFYEVNNQSCMYLIDDLAAELDETNQKLIFNTLMGLDAQLFITSTDKPVWIMENEKDYALFHVKHKGEFIHENKEAD